VDLVCRCHNVENVNSSTTVGSINHRSSARNGKSAQVLWHDPHYIRAKATGRILQTECNRVVTGGTMTSVITMRSENWRHARERLPKNLKGVRFLGLGCFAVLISHCEWRFYLGERQSDGAPTSGGQR
jgi:hypothetical protein